MSRGSVCFAIVLLLCGLVAAQYTLDASLPVPKNLWTEDDEFVSTLRWNGPESRMNDQALGSTIMPGVGSYVVYWKKQSDDWSVAKKININWQQVQLQPLAAGIIYEAHIAAIGLSGKTISAYSNSILFQSNSTRVDNLRRICTGFFEDFNRPAGPFDSTKLVTAWSGASTEEYTYAFINDQLHAHSMGSTEGRTHIATRPLNKFDFTGRTGNIYVDVDTVGGRDAWYMEISPALADVVGHVFVPGDGGNSGPVNSIRIRMNGNGFNIIRIWPDGTHSDIDTQLLDLEWANNYDYKRPNVRTPMHVLISKTAIEVRVREHPVVSAAFNPPLPWEQAYVFFALFDYNTPKNNEHYEYVTTHWDNFGFDGPAPTVNTFNYPTRSFRGYMPKNNPDSARGTPVYADVNIPDDFSAASEIRLLFTQCGGYPWMPYWSTSDNVVVNGNRYSITPPPNTLYAGFGTLPADSIVAESSPFTSVVILQKQHLVRGVNKLTFWTTISRVGHVHIEIDVPKTQSYTYTDPPSDMPMFAGGFPVNTYEAPFSSGGIVNIDSIGTKDPFYWWSDSRTIPQAATSNAVVRFSCSGTRQVSQYGSNRGHAYAELFINRTSVAVMNLNGAPYVEDRQFTFDSRALSNGGSHDIWVMCWGTDGGSSAFMYDWDYIDPVWNRYTPLTLQITGGGSQSVPLNAQPQDAKVPFVMAPAAPPQFVPSVRTFTPSGTVTQQTTTQAPTTAQQTTTQAPTTAQPTTTQAPTTAQQTTTQAPTTAQQTTTQSPTTTQQTTTQQPTTTAAAGPATVYDSTGLSPAWSLKTWGTAAQLDAAVAGSPSTKNIRWDSKDPGALSFRTDQCFAAGSISAIKFSVMVSTAVATTKLPTVRLNLRGCDANTNFPSLCATSFLVKFAALNTWTEIAMAVPTSCPIDTSILVSGFQLARVSGSTDYLINLANVRFELTTVVKAQADSASSSSSASLPTWAIALIVVGAVLAVVAAVTLFAIIRRRRSLTARTSPLLDDTHYQMMKM